MSEKEEKLNVIRISFPDCCEVEVQSEELPWKELKKEAFEILETANSKRFKTPPYKHDVI